MTWPPEGSEPPIPPRPTPTPKPRPRRPSPGETTGETSGGTKVKPQAKTGEAAPPQFGHDGIDPMRAALILGLPLLAAGLAVLFAVASPLVWWIAAGIAAAGVLGGVVLRRSKRARAAVRRIPGASRAASALRRTTNGRFASSPLGRVLRRRPGASSGGRSGGLPGGSSSRPKTLGGRLRSVLPSWAGGTRKPSSAQRPGGAGGSPSGGRSGGRMRSLLNRLKPAGAGRPGGSGKPSSGGAKTNPRGLLGRAAAATGKAAGKASRAVGSKLFRIRPGASPSAVGGTGKPSGKGKAKPPGGGGSGGGSGSSSSLDLGLVWTGARAGGRLVGRGASVLLDRYRRRKKPDAGDDDFDPDSTYEVGIDGTKVNGKLQDADVTEAKARAKARERAAKKAAKAAPEWPNVDVDELPAPPPPPPPPPANPDAWPDYDVDDYAPQSEQLPPPPQERSLPAEQDRDPPPSPPVSPPSHRETPRITSANTGGTPVTQAPKITQQSSPSGISAANYAHHITTTPDGRATGWDESADHARRDAVEFDSKADKKDAAAAEFARTGNKDAEDKARADAARFREDASACRTIAALYQEEANKEATSAA